LHNSIVIPGNPGESRGRPGIQEFQKLAGVYPECVEGPVWRKEQNELLQRKAFDGEWKAKKCRAHVRLLSGLSLSSLRSLAPNRSFT